MGRLQLRGEITDHSWYGGKYYPSEAFPHSVAIHIDQMDGEKVKERVEIREWIERSSETTVVMDYMDLGYYYQYGNSWNNGFQVTHGYYRFWFTDQETAVAFSLRFSSIVSTTLWEYKEQYPCKINPTNRHFVGYGEDYDRNSPIWEEP